MIKYVSRFFRDSAKLEQFLNENVDKNFEIVGFSAESAASDMRTGGVWIIIKYIP